MKKLSVGLLLVCGFVPAGAAFFDDFEGDALGPWWRGYVHGKGIFFEVRESWLSVAVLGTAYFRADTTTLEDFEMTTRLKWGVNPENSVMAIGVSGWELHEDTRPNLYAMWYRVLGDGTHVLQIRRGGILHTSSLPADGIHDFRMSRIGSVARFYVDDVLVYTDENALMESVRTAAMQFTSGNPRELSVDYIRVVPEPLSLTSLGLLLLLPLRRWRRR